MCITGRSDIFSPLETQANIDSLPGDSSLNAMETPLLNFNLHKIIKIRNEVVTRDAQQVINTVADRRIRTGVMVPLRPNDMVDVFFPRLNRWISQYRVIAAINSHVIMEKGKTLFNRPL